MEHSTIAIFNRSPKINREEPLTREDDGIRNLCTGRQVRWGGRMTGWGGSSSRSGRGAQPPPPTGSPSRDSCSSPHLPRPCHSWSPPPVSSPSLTATTACVAFSQSTSGGKKTMSLTTTFGMDHGGRGSISESAGGETQKCGSK
jgi:hypothetical protein